MTHSRFEKILEFLQLSYSDDKDQHILDFLESVNKKLKYAISPELHICIDESMIKAFHHNLPVNKLKADKNFSN